MTSTLPVPDSQGHDPRTGSDGTAARHPGGEDLWHPALFYRSPEEYLATAVPFLAEALTAGHPAAVAAPGRA
ncbi:MEDS domain-containing protein [Thermomonospora amylolytica]|uniref:MEDS domain-containing protein n=1 Tax=Thermomonospora amylolytica TaxID=1411117 RepID=UPI001F170738|nr:MEDS domain-containing protein [Thermomonospora amylolytica]